jgi:hypothetical protein
VKNNKAKEVQNENQQKSNDNNILRSKSVTSLRVAKQQASESTISNPSNGQTTPGYTAKIMGGKPSIKTDLPLQKRPIVA